MILTDSGVLIDFLRTNDARLGQLLRTLPVAVCGVVRAEIFAGARGQRQKLIAFLQPFRHIIMPDSLWDQVGDDRDACYAAGLTVPFSDSIIATLAIHENIEVWTRDTHFPLMQKVLPSLKLFQEPP